MHTAQITCSQVQPTMSITLSSSHPTDPSPLLEDDINALFDSLTPTLTLLPLPSQMAEEQQPDSPPPMAPILPTAMNPLPAMDPNIQNTMTTLTKAMTHQFQAQAPLPANPPHCCRHQLPSPNCHTPGTCVKTRDPDPYKRSDLSRLCVFLSQCKLVFQACPDDLEEDKVKITYAVSWLKGTALRWYEPNLLLHDHDLPQFTLHWDTFKETLQATFGEPDPINSATQKLDNLCMINHHHITTYNVEFNEYSAIMETCPLCKVLQGTSPSNQGWTCVCQVTCHIGQLMCSSYQPQSLLLGMMC